LRYKESQERRNQEFQRVLYLADAARHNAFAHGKTKYPNRAIPRENSEAGR